MKKLNITNLYRFELLPDDEGFFNSTYRLVGRSGQLGAIDQLLKIYPHCYLGIECSDVHEGNVYLNLYIFFYRNVNGQIRPNDAVLFSIGIDDEHEINDSKTILFKTQDLSALFFASNAPELYFLGASTTAKLIASDKEILEGQRIFFNEKLEKVSTPEIEVEEVIGDNYKDLDFILTNSPLSIESINKINLIANG